MASINQNAYSSALPNFRNLGTLLRILLSVSAVACAAAVLRSATLSGFWPQLLDIMVLVQPLLILSLLALFLLSDLLRRLPYLFGVAVVVLLELLLTALLHHGARHYLAAELPPLERYAVLVAPFVLVMLSYLNLRARALSPALSEARLQALQARIRPHFLYNSINAVLSLMRQDPRRAETALEDLADLFRSVMADNRDLVPLAGEVALCRRYLDLEQLRLGERLRIVWHTDGMPGDAMIPPLVLQPLLENAVYHGIEPRTAPGEITVAIHLVRSEVHMLLRNPYEEDSVHHAGNRMAVANIRERLALHFDAEASLDARLREGVYEVRIVIPYVRSTQS